MTKGEYRVGKTFNPSGDDVVATIKAKAAELIDLIEAVDDMPRQKQGEDGKSVYDERRRLKALAQTAIEEGAMWAVKAATKQERDA